MTERRSERRLPAQELNLSRATLRPGRSVRVVDLSRSGARIETNRPLRPGTHVFLRLVFEDATHATAAAVLRCTVAAIDPDEGVIYSGALRFEPARQAAGELRLQEPDGWMLHAGEVASEPVQLRRTDEGFEVEHIPNAD